MKGGNPEGPRQRGDLARRRAASSANLKGDRDVARRRAKPTLAAAEDIAGALKVLSDHLAAHGVDSGLVHLGGGSVLAAAWRHRQSTDIDLWVSHEQVGRMTTLARNDEEWKRIMRPTVGQIENVETSLTQASARMTLNGVPISLFTTHFAGRMEKNRQMMRGTIFGAATTEEILSGKIIGRWGEAMREEIPIRDVYDIYVARTLEPNALKQAMGKMTREQRRTAASQLRALPENWHEQDRKPVIEPRFDVELRGAARRLAAAIEEGDWTRIEICNHKSLDQGQQENKGWNL